MEKGGMILDWRGSGLIRWVSGSIFSLKPRAGLPIGGKSL
jgi:hypothetical protein